ncbi:prepilin-type N-terminal cleavage/methylation domain-containing protein [Desulfobacterales bacterium HSG2]|nr:prepilin-type N-terminal cleavage/methylation domain-containing protein [Desulfobacterales bacterium HSG2]
MKNMSDLRGKTGNWKPETGNRKPETGNRKPETGNRKPETGNRKPETGNRKPEAFTLLEVMVAVSIMAIVLIAVYRMQAQTIAMSNASRFYTTAPLLAQSKIAELGIISSVELGGGSGDFGEDFPGYTWNLEIEEMESEVLGNLAKDLKRIDVSVNFNEGEFVYGFRTYKFLEEK